jgi:hypothetical protein
VADADRSLDGARLAAGLSHVELWDRYFSVGGMSTRFELEAILHGALVTTDHDHDLIAVALNERFSELGADHRVAYTSDAPERPGELPRG